MQKLALYLDMDGVILRATNGALWNAGWEIAPHADAFLRWALKHHRPIWLTARDRNGDGRGIASAFDSAINRNAETLELATAIPSGAWRGVKTSAIDFREDFLWLDDCPRPEDLIALERERCVERWIEVNTDVRPDDLLRIMSKIEAMKLISPVS